MIIFYFNFYLIIGKNSDIFNIIDCSKFLINKSYLVLLFKINHLRWARWFYTWRFRCNMHWRHNLKILVFSSILTVLASPNIIFLLLIIWVFHTVHPNHSCFPFLPSWPSHFSVLPLRKIYQVPFVLPGYSLYHDQITSGQPLRENWVLSHFPARSHQLWGSTLQHLYHSC